jgi:hypothetical protein
MPGQRDITQPSGGQAAATLARRLGDAVNSAANGKAHGHPNGNGAIETPSARQVAIDVCSAILAETSAGTAEHSSDVVLITEAIGERMGLVGSEAEDLLAAARLHDIGKAWVPKPILEKAGSLTEEEWEIMRQHTVVGEEILSPVAELADVGQLVRHSHERWDGDGYPDGLKGAAIPLGSRIIFCADAFHAIRSDRPYRAGRSADEALAEIKRCAGTQFDPTVSSALEEVVRERRRQPAGMRSSRLFALLMCLVIGGAGTAVARSGLMSESGSPPPSSARTAPPACGTSACPSVAGPVGGLAPVGVPGPRALHPGLPGLLHRQLKGGSAGGHDGSANHGDGEAASQDHSSNRHGKALGHSGDSHPGNGSGSSHGKAPESSSSGHTGKHSGGQHANNGKHMGSGGHSSGGTHASSGSGSSGGSQGNGGGNDGGASHVNSGSSGSSANSGSSGKSHGD